MKRSRPFTAFSPVALRLGVCALIAACVILPVTPPFAAGEAPAHSAPTAPVADLVFVDARAAGPTFARPERGGKDDRLETRVTASCSARHWDHEGACYLPATEATPARSVRIVTLERREGNVSTLERRVVSSNEAQ